MKKQVSGARCQVLAIALVLCTGVCGQVADKANEGYKTKEGRESVAKTLNAPDRNEKEKPKELVAAMSLQPGMVVADIGTGVGYMLPYLSAAVGPSGKVLAEDIFPDFLDKAKATAKSHGLSNVEFIHGTVSDPSLPENAVDAALALESYHHWDYPEKMLAALHRQLRGDGRLVIVDFYKRPDAMPNGQAMKHIRLDLDEVIKEVEANHFRLVSQHDHIKGSQYMAIFAKN